MTAQVLRTDLDVRRLIAWLEKLPLKKPWQFLIEPYRKSRSTQQNRALWGVAYNALKEQSGNDPEDLHSYFCGEFFGWVEVEIMGQRKRKPRRTTTTDDLGNRAVMPTVEFCAFYEFIQQRAAENGFYVSSPNEEEIA